MNSQSVEQAILDAERENEAYAAFAFEEDRLHSIRPRIEEDIKRKLLTWEDTPGDRDGEQPPRASSPSAAEKMCKHHPDYLAHLEGERWATKAKNLAYGKLIAARSRSLLRLVEFLRGAEQDNIVAGQVENLLDLDLIRNPDDARERMPGGVPQ